MTDAFGAFAPSRAQQRFRRLAAGLPDNYLGRRAASLLLGPAGGRARRAFDVDVFGSQRARLHPYDNISEKRVFLTPQFWERAEREALAAAIANCRGEEFHFVDVGANAGLYTLFANAEARRRGKTLRALCIEADPEMAARLDFNLAASGLSAVIRNVAASDADGRIGLEVNRESRGESRVGGSGGLDIEARRLRGLVREAGLARIDAMKVDIEGHETRALQPFFADAPQSLWPAMLIIETSHADAAQSAEALALRCGYHVRLKSKRNAVLARDAQAPG